MRRERNDIERFIMSGTSVSLIRSTSSCFGVSSGRRYVSVDDKWKAEAIEGGVLPDIDEAVERVEKVLNQERYWGLKEYYHKLQEEVSNLEAVKGKLEKRLQSVPEDRIIHGVLAPNKIKCSAISDFKEWTKVYIEVDKIETWISSSRSRVALKIEIPE